MSWTEKLPSGKYRGCYRNRIGEKRYLKRTYTQAAEAKRAAAVEENKHRTPGMLDPKAGRMPWGEWCDQWLPLRGVEPGTQDRDGSRLRNHLRPKWGGIPLDEIDREEVQRWVNELSGNLSPSSVAKCYHLLSASLKEAVLTKKIHASPCVSIKLPPIPPSDEYFLTHEEYARLYAHLPTQRDRLLVDLLVNTGMRWGEAVGAHRNRVHLPNLRLDVHEVHDGKVHEIKPYPKEGRRRRSKKRSVPLSREFAGNLQAWFDDHPDPMRCRTTHRNNTKCRSGLIVPGHKEAVIDYHNWRREVWVPAITAAGLPTVRIHDLRHTFASWLIQSGKVTIEELKELLGHAQVTTTERYAHLGQTQWDAVRSALSDSAIATEQSSSDQESAPYLPHATEKVPDPKIVDLASRRRSAG